MPEEVREYKDQLEGRAMLVKKAKVIPLEAIVRGYLTGWHRVRITEFASDLSIPDRLRLVGIQEEWNNSRDSDAPRSDRISKTSLPHVYPFDKGRARSA